MRLRDILPTPLGFHCQDGCSERSMELFIDFWDDFHVSCYIIDYLFEVNMNSESMWLVY